MVIRRRSRRGFDLGFGSIASRLVLAAWLAGAAGRVAAEELATIETPLGNITIRLLRDKAPRHVDNFEKLAADGFYDATTFHRVIPGYIVQGGSPKSRDADPKNDNFGGPDYTLRPEFNDVPHERGVVSMGRNPDVPDSAGSQFFIVLGRAPQLDEIKFTVFGRVVDGMEVADRIASAPRDVDNHDRPLDPVVVKKIRVSGAPGSATPSPALVAAGSTAPTPTAAGTPAGPRVQGGGTASDSGRVRTTQDFVNIREGPAADRTVLQKVRKGTEMPTRGRQGDWVAVALASGKTGYVRKDMVEPAPADLPSRR